ncbi:MAG: hypothetical protein CO127_00875 [Ignavibacteria bacterium CG_4_9_14_3_um_filter_36_18]|nr:MAG: hypothetical protein CO127_00875 [Ignavibacteria bacterium CG_4_9_14_3_um_filter_36_18]
MELIEQVALIILFALIIKGISLLYDRPTSPKPEPGKIPDELTNSDVRKFFWVVENNIQSYSLNCEIKINLDETNKAKEELLNENSQPSKVYFTSEEEYFIISKIQILHDKFGVDSDEVDQIVNYLRSYADQHMMSNYQFANLILSFVHEQNIKYSYDEDSTGHMEYLRFPIETICDITGDCDCKAILACTLFKKLGYKVAFALMPGHAALAISTESAPFYSNFEKWGIHWYYCESTGSNWSPGQLPSGIYRDSIKIREI